MLYHLGIWLADSSGPFRLFTSYIFLGGLGAALATILTWWLLPRCWHLLPKDQGRAFAVDAEESVGKPVGAGILFIGTFLLLAVLIVPFKWQFIGILGCVAAASLLGFRDDCTRQGLPEYLLGALDLVIAVVAAVLICQLDTFTLWFPVYKEAVEVGPAVFIPMAVVLIWVSINATNCTDGVDGLSASLASLGVIFLGGVLYGIVGHQEIADYLLVPHYPLGADWGLLALIMVGCLAGYLWHNSYPSSVLMGDAGSRPVGLMLGMLAVVSGNPFLILVVAFVILVNGATGLVKVAMQRFFNIGIFRQVRYPLHDHVRHKLNWSNTQVLVRFMLLQAVCTPVLLVLLLKVR